MQERWRRQCRRDLTSWCIEAQRHEGFVPARHHAYLLQILSEVIDGERSRVIVTLPPGSGKTRYTTWLGPPFAFLRHPRWNIIGVSHTGGLAETYSGQVQNYIRDNESVLEYRLRTEAVGEWWTSKGGFYVATGVGGALPGRRADLVIMDDVIKGREAAESENDREKVWRWYWGSLRHRLKPKGRIIITLTRWHEDDLVGRLLASQPGVWDVINLPAEAEANDALGRAPGEWLWSDPEDPYGYGAELAEKKAEMLLVGSMREWWSQYQGRPRPEEGSLFRIGKIETIEEADIPAGTRWVRAWDLAATAQIGTNDPDSTVGIRLGRTPTDEFIIGHVLAMRGGPDAVQAAIVDTAWTDGKAVRVGIPQDPGQAGKVQVLYLTKALAGYSVESSPETGDKATRAGPVAAQCNVGNIKMVRGLWNARMRDELAAFPSGRHDDHVDALSRAFSMIALAPKPMRFSAEAMAGAHRR